MKSKTDLVRLSEEPNCSAIINAESVEYDYNSAASYLEIGELELATQAALKAVDSGHQTAHILLEKVKQAYYTRGLNFLNKNR